MQEIRGSIGAEGSSGSALTFKVRGSGVRTLMAFSEDGVKKNAAGITANKLSSWYSRQREADMVIIAHGDFMDALGSLKDFRESQGLSVALIDVEDLYDEFGFGHRGPGPIRAFVIHAGKEWQRPPRFVLLAGDASLDPRDYFGMGYSDFVPTRIVDTEYIETASDEWFADTNGDGLAELALGRLPVRTAGEAALVVSKIIDFEQSSHERKGLLVADANDSKYNFQEASRSLKAVLPGDITIEEIFRGQGATSKSDLLASLNQGQLLVNYMGHGSVEIWRGSFLTSSDALALTNSPNLPFFVSMTCLNGFFQDIYTESLAEALIRSEQGGAVAVWASSGISDAGEQAAMNLELYRLLFNGEELTIGEATMRAKRAITDKNVRRTWILFGDPTTRLE
jgi:hypothetical protein